MRMNETGISKHDQVLAGLVLSLQAAALQHLGKITSPLTGKVERDLEQARGTIDILEMLKVKCRSETHAEVLRLLDTAVMEVQMNYLDEVKKDQAGAATEGQTETAAEEAGGAATAGDEPGEDEARREASAAEPSPEPEADETEVSGGATGADEAAASDTAQTEER
jgi:hypothetical protein